jgi:hypothetical protein
MTYRDDHEATRQRADALERQLALAVRDNQELARGKPGGFDWNAVVGPSLAVSASGAFTVMSLWLAWSVWWSVAGFVMFGITVIALLAGGSSKPNPTGAVPIALDVGERRLLALVRMYAGEAEKAKKALELYAGRTHEDIAAAAAVVLEPIAFEGKEGEVAVAVARERLATIGLQLESLWVSPARREPHER